MLIKKKICMLGYYGVGKTSLVSQFVNNMFSDKYQTTVGVKIDKKVVQAEGQEVTLMLWDVAGEEDNTPVKISHVKDASGYLLVLDGRRRKTLEAAVSIQQRVETEVGKVPFLLLANKNDERADWEVSDADLADLATRGWTVMETSAKTGERVEEAFLTLTADMLKCRDEDAEDDD
jgi:small GTP-binding protein